VINTRKIKASGLAIVIMLIIYAVITMYSENALIEEGNMINVYFFNPQTGRLEAERRVMPEGNYLEVSQELWEMLVRGPESAFLSGIFPESLDAGAGGSVREIRNVQPTPEDRGIRYFEVYFREDYLNVAPIDEVIFRSAIVWTFTELDWISNVSFFVENMPLARLDGSAIGLMSRDNVLISPQITMEHIVRRTVSLYFPNSMQTGLVLEHRTVEIPSHLTIEQVVLNELIRGPLTPGLVSLIPPETVIYDVYTESLTMTCYVDLNVAFDLRLTPVTHTRQLAVYSIVHSLINIRGAETDIERVQFLINGERVAGRGVDVDLSRVFELNEELVIPRPEMELM